MANMGNYMLPPPPALEIHNTQAARKQKQFRLAWDNYSFATKLSEKSQAVKGATLLTVVGEEAGEIFFTFRWASESDKKIKPGSGAV